MNKVTKAEAIQDAASWKQTAKDLAEELAESGSMLEGAFACVEKAEEELADALAKLEARREEREEDNALLSKVMDEFATCRESEGVVMAEREELKIELAALKAEKARTLLECQPSAD